MLKDAPIVILDEATANVDPENEERLQRAIEELTRDKTIIMIAHRLKTVCHADQIFVVNDGGIVQRGTHEELIGQPGIYADFVSGQKRSGKLEIVMRIYRRTPGSLWTTEKSDCLSEAGADVVPGVADGF